jgi:hypothetical protein
VPAASDEAAAEDEPAAEQILAEVALAEIAVAWDESRVDSAAGSDGSQVGQDVPEAVRGDFPAGLGDCQAPWDEFAAARDGSLLLAASVVDRDGSPAGLDDFQPGQDAPAAPVAGYLAYQVASLPQGRQVSESHDPR